MSSLQNVITRLLSAEGALVEPAQPDGLTIVAPPHVQSALAIPECSCIGFGAELPKDATKVSLESDWLERLALLMDRRGRLCSLELPKSGVQASLRDPGAQAAKEVELENAVHRLADSQDASTVYLLIMFRLTAVSDEKREEILNLCVNETNGAFADHLPECLLSQLPSFMRADATEQARPPDALSLSRILTMCERASQTRARAQLSPFLGGMERRMTRDIDRLHAYHSDLRKEAAHRLAEKIRKGESQEAGQRERLRLTAIEREFHSKVADLQRKFAISVKIEPLQAMRIRMPVVRLSLTFMRRKGTRSYHLDWNPVSKKLDCLPCESCYTVSGIRLLCDAKLHFLCRACLPQCPQCGKFHCRACHPAGCPVCAKK